MNAAIITLLETILATIPGEGFKVVPADKPEHMRIQIGALRTIVRSLEAQVGFYRKAYKTNEAFRAEIESERAANALLTEEVAALKRDKARMLDAAFP